MGERPRFALYLRPGGGLEKDQRALRLSFRLRFDYGMTAIEIRFETWSATDLGRAFESRLKTSSAIDSGGAFGPRLDLVGSALSCNTAEC